MEIKQMNIYQRMLAATNEISRVKKNLSVSTGKGSYKAVGEGDVLSAVKPIEIEYGIYSYPINRRVIETQVLINENDRRQLFMRIETTYRFVNMDKPDEYVDMVSFGDGVDSQDKAPGKAMTYADKYALLKAYKIETGDDPDQEGSRELRSVERKLATENQIQMILSSVNGSPERLSKMFGYYGVRNANELTMEQASEALRLLQKENK